MFAKVFIKYFISDYGTCLPTFGLSLGSFKSSFYLISQVLLSKISFSA